MDHVGLLPFGSLTPDVLLSLISSFERPVSCDVVDACGDIVGEDFLERIGKRLGVSLCEGWRLIWACGGDCLVRTSALAHSL